MFKSVITEYFPDKNVCPMEIRRLYATAIFTGEIASESVGRTDMISNLSLLMNNTPAVRKIEVEICRFWQSIIIADLH